MRKLTDYQRNFLLDKFFKNETYPGWRTIATSLLDTGQCIVAGDRCIWVGGVGNFIDVNPAEGLVDCSLYVFDADEFFSSNWYSEVKEFYFSDLLSKKRVIEQECEEIATI